MTMLGTAASMLFVMSSAGAVLRHAVHDVSCVHPGEVGFLLLGTTRRASASALGC